MYTNFIHSINIQQGSNTSIDTGKNDYGLYPPGPPEVVEIHVQISIT